MVARVPNEVLRMRGTDGHGHRLTRKDAPPVTKIPGQKRAPSPHRPLGPEGAKVWRKVWNASHLWMSPDSDTEALLMLCETIDERVIVKEMLAETPGDVACRRTLRLIDAQITTYLRLLGLTPTDRAKFGVAEVEVEDELASFRKRVG